MKRRSERILHGMPTAKPLFAEDADELLAGLPTSELELLHSTLDLLAEEGAIVDAQNQAEKNHAQEPPQPEDLRTRIIGFGGDSMRKSYYPALRRRIEELERYRQVIDRAHEGIFLLDLPGLHFTDANLSTCEIFGTGRDFLLRHSLRELLDPAGVEGVDAWLQSREQGARGHFTFSFRRPDNQGGERRLELSLSFVNEGRIQALVGMVRDLSELYRVNDELKKTDRLFHAVLDNSFQFTGLLNREGRMLFANRTALVAAGVTDQDVLGQEFWETCWWPDIEEDRQRLKKSFLRCIKGEFIRYQTFNQTAGGQRLWVDFSMKPVFGDGQEVLFVIAEGRDITEQKVLEEQLLHSQKMEAIGQLAGGIAHDFNNLLGGIIGAAELLSMQGPLTSGQEKLKQIIMDAAEHAADLTHNLLSFARKNKSGNVPVDVHLLVNDTLQMLQRSIDRRIRLELALEATFWTVSGDPAQLQTSLLNLGINARDAMPEGGTLRISTRNIHLDSDYCAHSPFAIQPGEYIRISVEDTGHGITPELKQRIFEPFFTTKDIGKGTGLGLAAVYGMIKTHRGCIEVESAPGAGATFHLYLPLTVVSPDKPATEKATDVPHGSGVILLVDDEDLLIETGRAMLQSLGFDVLAAGNGREAISLYREQKDVIRLIIMDMVMPEMSGGEAVLQLKQINPDVRILVVTGYSTPTATKYLEEGVCGFLPKPFRLSDLSRAVFRALGEDVAK